jgi:hypothetical protein
MILPTMSSLIRIQKRTEGSTKLSDFVSCMYPDSKVAPLQHSIKYKGKLTHMLMHLNDSQIIANIYFTTKDKSCESVYKKNY